MKKILYIYFALIFAPVFASAHGQMQLIPQSATSYKIDYDANEYFGNSADLAAYNYVFNKDEDMPKLIVTDLQANSGKYTANLKLDDEPYYIISKVVSSDGKIDNNFMKYFVFLTKSINPPENYFLKVALFYMGSLPENCRMDIDYTIAEDYFRKELKQYPDNLQAEIGLTSLLFDIKKIGQKEYTQKLENILRKKFDIDDEANVKSASRALKMINQAESADKLEKLFIQKHPKSDLAEEKLLMELANASSRDQFVSIAKKYFTEFPDSKSKTKIYNALVSSFLQNGKYSDLKAFLANQERVPGVIYLSVANRLIEDANAYKGANLADRVKEARQMIALNENMINNSMDLPQYLSPKEIKEAKLNMNIMLNFIIAKSYVSEENYGKAIESFRKVWDYDRVYDQKFYELYALSLFELNKIQDGLKVLESAAINTILTEELEEKYKDKYTTVNSVSDSTFTEYLDSLLQKNKEKRMTTLADNELDRVINSGSLKTLDGEFVDLSDMKGSVVVVLLWSSWCGPCQTMFPVYDDLYEQYKESNDIIILSVNIWERNDEETNIYDFLNEAEVNFPVLTDEASFIPKNAGINGLPMTLIFGKEGKLKFKIQGFSGDKKFVADVLDRAEYLLK